MVYESTVPTDLRLRSILYRSDIFRLFALQCRRVLDNLGEPQLSLQAVRV